MMAKVTTREELVQEACTEGKQDEIMQGTAAVLVTPTFMLGRRWWTDVNLQHHASDKKDLRLRALPERAGGSCFCHVVINP